MSVLTATTLADHVTQHAFNAFDARARNLKRAFFIESQRLWYEQKGYETLPTIAAAILLFLGGDLHVARPPALLLTVLETCLRP